MRQTPMGHRRREALVLAGVLMASGRAAATPARAHAGESPRETALCADPAIPALRPAPRAPDGPDWLLRVHRYLELAAWVAGQRDHHTARAPAVAYFRGVLANRQNLNGESIRLLVPLSSHLSPLGDSARLRVVLETLADDYTKTYQYGAAAEVLRRLERLRGASM